MNLQDLTLQQLKEILRDAPEGATHVVDYAGIGKYDYLKNPDTWAAWYGSHWSMPGVLLDLSDKTIIKLSNIRTAIAELEPVKVGDKIVLTGRDQCPKVDVIGPMDFNSGFVDCTDIYRLATPEEIAAGHRIDAISDEMASPCAVSDSATNQAEMDLQNNESEPCNHVPFDLGHDDDQGNCDCLRCGKTLSAIEVDRLWRGYANTVTTQLDHEATLFDPMTNVDLEVPVSASQQQIGGNHYTKLAIQPMHYSLANNLNAAQHTIIKYVTRYPDKGGIQDLLKARHTIDLLIERLKGEQGE